MNDLQQLQQKLLVHTGDDLPSLLDEIDATTEQLPQRLNANPDNVAKGLAQLVLTLIELLRQLLERQALRRMEAGSLTDGEIERLGQTFISLNERMDELKKAFDLKDEDLNLNLGPLGDLL